MRYFLFIILSFVVAAGYSASRLTDLREQAYLFPQVALRQIDSLQQKAQYPSYPVGVYPFVRLFPSVNVWEGAGQCRESLSFGRNKIGHRAVPSDIYDTGGGVGLCVFAGQGYPLHPQGQGVCYFDFGSCHACRHAVVRRLSVPQAEPEQEGIRMCIPCGEAAGRRKIGNRDLLPVAYVWFPDDVYYISDRKYAEAWQIGLERSKLLSRLPELRRDNQSGYLYSKVAFLAHMLGKEFEDEKYYELFLGTHFSKTLVGRLEINDYLLTMKNYDQVIVNAQAYVREMDRRDTLNISYERLLQQACVAYEAVGDYRKAYAMAKRRLSIQQAIRLNNERNYLLENTDLFNALAAREELEEMEEKLCVQTIWLGVLTGILLLALLALGGFMRKGGKMRIRIVELEKLKVLHQYLLKKGQYAGRKTADTGKQEEKAAEEVVEQAVPEVPRKGAFSRLSNEELFALFDKKVRQEKLYLDYSLGRDQYARIMGVDKNRFASVLKEFGNTNLAAYLNSLRLEYAIELFHENPEWSISKIAEQSAIPNLSTFYRLFKDKYGMSPNLFRNKM